MVKAGDIVRVKVMEVDIPRKRIGLSMRLDDKPGESGRSERAHGDRKNAGKNRQGAGNRQNGRGRQEQQPQGAMAGALAQALASAKGKR